ncbi:MAG: cytochrome b/b6 domain-containing protein [Bryobacterales bacterium]|nr:cytochrome b/b6 domain-containing protein [Bryobacterales bacterium]
MPPAPNPPPHPAFVRWTHWITALAFAALLVSGVEILISHPRFYWGETGNVDTPALFQLPIPSSRPDVKTGYGYVLPDQNGWSRSLHFQSAWAVVFTGAAYLGLGLLRGHFSRRLWPARPPHGPTAYNTLQRLAYLSVICALFPFLIWTGLAMAPGLTAAYPILVTSLGGHQSARTLHFFAAIALALFAVAHVFMVYRAGFLPRVRAMITGQQEEV